MTRTKRIFSWALAVALLLSLCPVSQAAAAGTSTYNGTSYSTDYTTWRQGDAAWGATALGDVHTMAGSGCLISSIAILMCASGAYDPASLNPGSLRDWMDDQGYISHSEVRAKDALLSFGLMTSTASPRFYFVNQTFFETTTPLSQVVSKIDQLLDSGYYVIARVKNSGHFVSIAKTVEGDAQLYDPGAASKKLLSEYDGTIGGLIYFKANLSGKDTILSNPLSPDAPTMAKLSAAYGDGDRISVAWTGTASATHYNIYVDRKTGEDSWQSNAKYYFYCTSPYAMDTLPAGTYRVRVQATNANNWTYANASWQTFTVKANSLTITYNANGGSVSPGSELVSKTSTYDLPTPTRSGAAFLGWYTAQGKELVTNGTALKSTYGQTLVARWDEDGYSFTKSKTYSSSVFKDVSKSAWYYEAVAAVYEYGLMNGVETGKFKPTETISAAQTVTLAARLRKLYLTGNGTFSSTSPWYKTYSDYAVSQGILTAVPGDMNAEMTRQEFASILANALPTTALPEVNDVENGSIPDVYKSDTGIYRLYRAGIFTGSDAAGTFRPNDPITRAEVAAVLLRLADPNQRVLFDLE